MTTPTTNYSWGKPVVGADTNTWGGELNTLFDAQDAQVFTVATAAATAQTAANAAQTTANAALPRTGGTMTGSVVMTNAGLLIRDNNNTHNLIVSFNTDLTSDRTLTLITGNIDRSLTLAGDATISGTNTGDVTVLPIANGGTASTSASAARTALGLATVAATGSFADLSSKPTVTYSTPFTLALGISTFTHNLGVAATVRLHIPIICTSADAGYSVGDTIVLGTSGPANSSNNLISCGTSVGGNSSFVIIGIGVTVPHKGTFASTNLTLNKWNLYIGVETFLS